MVFRNLRSFYLSHPVFFMLMLLCTAVSSALMLFGYGLYQDYMLEQKAASEASREVSLLADLPFNTDELNTISDAQMIRKSDLDACLSRLDAVTQFAIEGFAFTLLQDSDRSVMNGIQVRFSMENGVYQPLPVIYESAKQRSKNPSGQFFTAESYQAGEAEIIVPYADDDSSPNGQLHQTEIVLDGKPFRITAYLDGAQNYEAIYPALPDSMILQMGAVRFHKPLSAVQYTNLQNAFASVSDWLTLTQYHPFYGRITGFTVRSC